ncbi:NAD(P)-dependent alcohol dehydrogenase [Planococcus sp. APC 4015]|nr:NAD(P)-dependent alcohol dehydrogenase [Planococcus sp. APC 4015]
MSTMKAWTQHRYGGPETVTLGTAPVPQPARGDVLVEVRSTSLNSGDVRLMRGEPLLVRLFFGIRRPRITGRGMDVAGVVAAVGLDVTGFAVGDAVVGELPGGGLAEFAVAPVGRLSRVPEGVSMTDAAALPIAAGTAWQALAAAGALPEGARVLIVGASGGVGTFAVQLAAARGWDVWALCGERSRALIEGLGASRTFDYRSVGLDSAELPRGAFDAVLVIAGAARLRVLQSLVRDGGAVVMVSGDGGRVLGPVGRIARAALLSIGSKRRIRSLAASPRTEVLDELLAQVAAGSLVPQIERTWPLASAGEALAHIDAGHTVGKVVVTVR